MSDVNAAVEVKVGRGQKACPGCGAVVGAAKKACDCGHVFIEGGSAGNKLAGQLRRARMVSDIPDADLTVVLRHLGVIAELGGVAAFKSVAEAVLESRTA